MENTPKVLKKKGKRLIGLDDLEKSLLEKSNTFKKKKIMLENKTKELRDFRKPKDGVNPEDKEQIKKDRNRLRREIKNLENDISDLSHESKEIIPMDERQKMNNLAKSINYPIQDFSEMDVIEYERNKKNLLYKAARMNDQNANIGAQAIITIASIAEMIPVCKGCSKELQKSKPAIRDSVNRLLIDMGMKDISVTQYINPWTALAFAVGAPILGAAITNLAEVKKKREALSQQQKILSASQKQDSGSSDSSTNTDSSGGSSQGKRGRSFSVLKKPSQPS